MPIIESVMGIQVIGNNGENIVKSPIVEAYIGSSLLDSTKVASDVPTDISTKVEQLMAAKHTHSNKAVLDKFSETDGKPTYGGQALGGGASTAEDVSYTVSEDIQNEFPELGESGVDTVQTGLDLALFYAFAGMSAKYIGVDIQAGGGTVTADLQTVMDNWLPAVKLAHEHDNKSVLDLLSDANGKLQYNGSDISVTKNGVINALGYTPEAVSAQVTTGSNITLADNTEYRLTDVTTLTLTYPTGNFECWMRLTFAASGEATVILPAGTEYLGATPNFKNGETWELSFKDKVLAAQKVGGDGCSSAPVKGIDYWTEEDKQEIVADTLAALPTWTGGSY